MSLTSSLKTYYINLAQDKKYPIIFGENAYLNLNKNDFGDATKAVLVTNSTIKEKCSDYIDKIINQCPFDVFLHMIEDGEEFKQLSTMAGIIDTCINQGLGRKDLLIAFGGGVVGDIAGFAAASYLRGVPFIQVPTSLLAQVDASIGGKTGVNHFKGKNLIGAFYQPIKTIIDPTLLLTLSKKEMREGLSEVIKYGVIKDKPLFWYIEQHAEALKSCQYKDCPDIWDFIIQKSIQDKALVVSQDEKESEYREILNFGHTIAHALELVFNYTEFSHGHALAIGMIVESIISNKLDYLSKATLERIRLLIVSFDFSFKISEINKDAFFSALKLDKKTRAEKVRFVLPTDIGQKKTVSNIDDTIIIDALNELLGDVL